MHVGGARMLSYAHSPSLSQTVSSPLLSVKRYKMSDRLLLPAWLGKLEEVRRLVEKEGVDPKGSVDRIGRTPLHKSCGSGHLPVARYLVEEQRCDPMCQDWDGRTPLHISCERGHLPVVRYLVEEQRCDPMCRDWEEQTPLHKSCGGGHLPVVRYLVEEQHCDPMCDRHDGTTPLDLALKKNHTHILKYLITQSPLQCEDSYSNILKHLIEKQCYNPKCDLSVLQLSCGGGYLRVVRYLIEDQHCDPMCRDGNRQTPLHKSCEGGHLPVVRYLVEEQHCDPKCRDRLEQTPLHKSCEGGHLPVVRYLVEEQHCDTKCRDWLGRTPLHKSCGGGHLPVVRYLVKEQHCDPKCRDWLERTPLHKSCGGGHLPVVRYLVEEQHCDTKCRDRLEQTPLHKSCGGGHLPVVRYLVEEHQCDPMCVDMHGRTPHDLALEKDHRHILKYLINPNLLPCEDVCLKFYKYLIQKQCFNPKECLSVLQLSCGCGYLQVVKYLIEDQHWDPKLRDEHGQTPLHCSCQHGHLNVVRYLIEDQHCDPKLCGRHGQTPLCCSCEHGHLHVVKYLIEDQHCDPKLIDQHGETILQCSCLNHLHVVKYLLEDQHCDPVDRYRIQHVTPLCSAIEGGQITVVKYLIETCHCDPNCVDKNGWAPLHYASKWGYTEIINYLGVECHCNPNTKDRYGRTPLDLAINRSAAVRELVKVGANATSKPPQPPVKVFIVGNPSAGKSSLTKALQTETSALGAALSSITGPRLVSDVEQKTAGIVPCQFTSRKFGNVIFYDFAGQQEYYASHAALLQNSISSSAPLFIIVVNLCDSEEDIKQKLVYWIFFLANQCTSVTTKPHVIIVGSHNDVIRSREEDPRTKVSLEFLQAAQMSNDFHISKFIPMDCRQSNSRDMAELAKAMKEICDALRKQFAIAYHLHQLFVFLLERFRDLSALRFDEVVDAIRREKYYDKIFTDNTILHDDLCELNDRGHITFLKGGEKWILLDQASLLSDVNGVLFAPEGFKQHCNLASATGVMPVSRLVQRFPKLDPDMLVQFLSYFDFCREICDLKVLQLIDPDITPHSETTCERYLFFSGLMSLEVPISVWEADPQFPQLCGWMLQCCEAEQLFTSQFLQVLLLRTAFSCALALDAPGSSDHPVLHRRCSIWKNGIFWGSRKGVEALVKIRDPPQNKEVVVMLRCKSGQEVECARLRSTIIQTVLEVKKKLCLKVPTREFLLHPSQVRKYPLKSPAEQDLISIREVSRAVVEGEMCVVGSNGRSIDMKELLLVEPYANLGVDILQQLFSGETNVISDKQLRDIAEQIHYKKDIFVAMLKVIKGQLEERISREAPFGEISEFVCVLQCWRGDSGTYQSLRETLDQFSVFAGRNPLTLTS